MKATLPVTLVLTTAFLVNYSVERETLQNTSEPQMPEIIEIDENEIIQLHGDFKTAEEAADYLFSGKSYTGGA